MKNLVLFAGILVAVSFASCGGNKEQAPEAAEAEAVVEEVVEAVEACCGDSACGDSCCAAAADSAAVVAE